MASVMTSQKTLPTPRDKKSNVCRGHVLDATNVLDVFCSCYSVIAKHSSAALPCKRFVNKRL